MGEEAKVLTASAPRESQTGGKKVSFKQEDAEGLAAVTRSLPLQQLGSLQML